MIEREPYQLISFLQKQNNNLKEEVKQIGELLKLNRQALAISIKFKQQESEKNLPALVNLLFQQNSKLIDRNAQLKVEVQKNLCQTLISEQIASASNEHEKYVTSQLKDRLKLVKKELDQKQKKIVQLMKNLSAKECDDDQKDNDVSIVEYTDMNKVSAKMFNQLQNLRAELQIKSQEIVKIKDQKQQLVKLNLILTKQVNELKSISCLTTKSQIRNEIQSTTDLSKFLKYQKKISDQNNNDSQYEDENQDSDASSISSSNQQEIQQQNNTQEASILEANKVEKPSKVVLPKLELKRAKEIQTLIVKKINNDEKKKSGNVIKQQKWKKLEHEIQELRKKMGEQIIAKHQFERQNSFLKKFINELEGRNEILAKQKQQKILEKNYEKERKQFAAQNMETLLDICRDVTLNQQLRGICKGKIIAEKKLNIYSKQI